MTTIKPLAQDVRNLSFFDGYLDARKHQRIRQTEDVGDHPAGLCNRLDHRQSSGRLKHQPVDDMIVMAFRCRDMASRKAARPQGHRLWSLTTLGT